MNFKIITDTHHSKTIINTKDINQVYKDISDDCLVIERAKFNFPHNEMRLKGDLRSFTKFLNSDEIEYINPYDMEDRAKAMINTIKEIIESSYEKRQFLRINTSEHSVMDYLKKTGYDLTRSEGDEYVVNTLQF